MVQLEFLFRILALNIKMQLSLHFCDLFSVAIIRVLIVKLWILLTFSLFIIFFVVVLSCLHSLFIAVFIAAILTAMHPFQRQIRVSFGPASQPLISFVIAFFFLY